MNTKISDVENKIPNHDKYIITPEFNVLTAENFTTRLKQGNLVSKTDFDKKVTSFNKWITSDRTEYLEVQKKLESLITKHNFFLGRVYFTSNHRSQNVFVYQPIVDMIELKKKTKLLIMFLVWYQMEYIILNLGRYILLSYIA